MRVTIDYPGEKDAPSLPAFGLEWALPGEFSHLRYYGLGPGDSYPDRCSGVRLGVWESTPSRTTHRTWYLRKAATTWVSVGLK